MNKVLKNYIYFTLIIFALVGIYLFYHDYLDKLPQDYTIGTFEGKWKPAKGGSLASFVYYVNDEPFKTSIDYHNNKKAITANKRFLVKYPEAFEWRGIVLIDHPIPDGVNAPKTGWDEFPELKKR